MNQDYKVILRDIVELFYQSPFKIFNVNTVDGETIVKPFGYFISLGITTSLESLKNIRDYISKSDYGFEARLSEICSVKSEKYGDYLNMLLPTTEENITKYQSSDLPNLLDKESAEALLTALSKKIQDGDLSVSPFHQRLGEIIGRIGSDWDSKSVLIKNDTPSIFYKYINYKNTGDAEYRIGIYAKKL